MRNPKSRAQHFQPRESSCPVGTTRPTGRTLNFRGFVIHTSTGRQSETVPDEREREGAQEAQAAAAAPSPPLMMTAATRKVFEQEQERDVLPMKMWPVKSD
uniref:HDC09235 n=1 Tax=Drosophila melanogaster TaxID=7227 RepID=Q6ILK1_DROME|nr:TPA_inf: HDC09235 [Drosophila melanogaster]